MQNQTDTYSILEKMNKSALRFLEPLTPQSTYAAIIDEAIKLVGGDEGFILLGEEESLKMVYAFPQDLFSLKLRKKGFSYTSFIKQKAMVVYAEDFGAIHPEVLERGIQSAIFIPLSYKNKSIGTMSIMSRQRNSKYTEQELHILKLFGATASLAIRKTQLYNETKQALYLRDAFISKAAHELRTPLTVLCGYIQMLHAKKKEENTNESRWVQELFKESFRMKYLVDELLQVNKVRSDKQQYSFKESNLSALIEETIADYKLSFPSRTIIFSNSIEPENSMIIADYEKLLQAVKSILSNAIRFSSPDTEIHLLLEYKKPDLVIEIKDHGQGIEKENLDKIFDGFKSESGVSDGLGLGLYLTKHIIDAHHGEISIKSKVNKGTVVKIMLPKAK